MRRPVPARAYHSAVSRLVGALVRCAGATPPSPPNLVRRATRLSCVAFLAALACKSAAEPFDAASVDLAGVWNFIETRDAYSEAGRGHCLFYTQVALTPYAFADTSLDYLAVFADSAHFDCGTGAEGTSPYYFAGEEYVVRHAGDSIIIGDPWGIRDPFTGRIRSPTTMSGLGHVFGGQTWRAARPGGWY
jgi:hypothetical protein